MSQLGFYNIRSPPAFIEKRRGHSPKTVSAHFALSIAQTAESGVDRVVRHGTGRASHARKEEAAASSERKQGFKNAHTLAGKGNTMFPPHFHFFGGDYPNLPGKVKLRPFRLPEFSGPHKYERGKTKGGFDDFGTRIAFQRAEEPPDFGGGDDGGHVF